MSSAEQKKKIEVPSHTSRYDPVDIKKKSVGSVEINLIASIDANNFGIYRCTYSVSNDVTPKVTGRLYYDKTETGADLADKFSVSLQSRGQILELALSNHSDHNITVNGTVCVDSVYV